MSVTRLRVSEPERLALALRRSGYQTADEVMELDEVGWQFAASNAGLDAVPNTATRCAVVALFGLQVANPPLAEAHEGTAPRSLVTGSEPAAFASSALSSHRAPGSNSERRT